ncbi:four helix bundle protein [Patescibacteria group bacterium]|nr:four helix bundle protein [Patescibacteria group bacterium]
MVNFHEHKLWQASYVTLMDLHTALETVDVDPHDREVVNDLLESAEIVAATIADSLTRRDQRMAHDLMVDAVGEVAKTRTHMAVAWGRGLLDDETFKKLDGKYDSLSGSLQSYR